MDTFITLLRALVWCSLLFSLVEVYLKINKLWKRKHERVVAESQSIMAETLSLLSILPLLILYIVDHQLEGIFDLVIWIPVNVLVIFIGAGFWIRGERGKGIWHLILISLRLERAEVGDLAKSFFKPAGSDKIIAILAQIAMIDDTLDKREMHFIETFARTWGIPFTTDDIGRYRRQSENWSFITLRESVKEYLAISPPVEQVAQLRDTIQALVNIDESVSAEEALVSSEMNGMLMNYVGEEGQPKVMYEVYIAPQSEEKERLVRTFLPNAKPKPSAGG